MSAAGEWEPANARLVELQIPRYNGEGRDFPWPETRERGVAPVHSGICSWLFHVEEELAHLP